MFCIYEGDELTENLRNPFVKDLNTEWSSSGTKFLSSRSLHKTFIKVLRVILYPSLRPFPSFRFFFFFFHI